MTSILQALKIGRTAAAEYAAQLVEDGYDTPDLLADIPEERMQQLGFKQPHIDRVLRARSPNTSQDEHSRSTLDAAAAESPEVQSVGLEDLVKQLEQDSSNADLWYAVGAKNVLKVLINGVEYNRKRCYEMSGTLDPDPTKAR